MKKFMLNNKIWFWILVLVLLVSGCAPGPPPPPVFPGLEWIIVAVLVIAAGILLWRKLDVSRPSKDDHLTEVLNEMNRQLKNLEDKIDKLLEMSKKTDKKNKK